MLSCLPRPRFIWSKKYHSHSHFDFCSSAAQRSAKQDIVSDVTIIGGGISGLASIHRLRNDGFTVNVIESGPDIGGTWFWNRYPGAVCDIDSMQYSFQFDSQLQQDYIWSEKYASQPQILSYLNHVADKHDLRKHIHFEQTVQQCTYSESNSNWTIETNTGHTYISPMLLLATGCLSIPLQPTYEGMEHYKGYVYYTSKWPPHTVDFSDKNVAIIGTGSSGIQCIPKIAETAKHLTVYQRTAQFMWPLHNKVLTDEEQQKIKDNYDELRQDAKNTPNGISFATNEKMFDDMTKEEYEDLLWHHWNEVGGIQVLGSCSDQFMNQNADKELSRFIKNRIREIVKDPKVADLLCPTDDLLYACKRPLFNTNYFETYNRGNVELISISDKRVDGTPIKSMTSNSIITSDGMERECDVLVFATGFDAMTGAALNIDIKGVDNETIQECWKDGPKTYLGLQTVGFPNMFMITGPHSPSVFTNMIPSIEQQVNWIADLFVYMKNNKLKCIEPTNEAQQDWVQFNNDIAEQILFGSPGCNSWYHGSNVDGKTRHFLPGVMGFNNYIEKCNDTANQNYMGFDFDLKSRKRQQNVL